MFLNLLKKIFKLENLVIKHNCSIFLFLRYQWGSMVYFPMWSCMASMEQLLECSYQLQNDMLRNALSIHNHKVCLNQQFDLSCIYRMRI